MNPVILIQLTENDKRIIIALCLVVVLVFVIVGLLGALIIRTMKYQGKKCDTLISDVVTYRIITEPGQLKTYARKKNIRYFLKQAWIPLLIMIVGALVYIIRDAVTKDWSYNPFNRTDGFGSLLFLLRTVYMKTGDGKLPSPLVFINNCQEPVFSVLSYRNYQILHHN